MNTPFSRGPIIRLWALSALLLPLAACNAPEGPTSFQIPAGSYAQAFDSTRETLRRERFSLGRVDADAGVISTELKPTLGLLSPWDSEQTSAAQEIADTLNQHHRVVTIRFRPAGLPMPAGSEIGSQAAPAPLPIGLTRETGPIVAEVSVVLYRHRRTGWQPDPSGIGLTMFMVDTTPGRPPARFAEPIRRDDRYAAVLAGLISEAVAAEEDSEAQTLPIEAAEG